MKGGKYQSFCGDSFLMHIYRNSSSIICNCAGAILFQNYMNQAAVSCQMFIYCIVYDLIDQVIQTFS